MFEKVVAVGNTEVQQDEKLGELVLRHGGFFTVLLLHVATLSLQAAFGRRQVGNIGVPPAPATAAPLTTS